MDVWAVLINLGIVDRLAFVVLGRYAFWLDNKSCLRIRSAPKRIASHHVPHRVPIPKEEQP
jgi:hypothetical protein